MRKNDFKVSELKGAVNNPEILKKAKSMYPDLNGMSDEDFARLAENVIDRCDRFIAKYGDLSGEEIYELGIKKDR